MLSEDDFWIGIYDEYPVSEGHALLIPKRHVTTLSNLTHSEATALYYNIRYITELLMKKHNPNGFNIGVNQGEAAGQSIDHLHVHIIPRYTGDVENPRGGVRGVIPEKQNY